MPAGAQVRVFPAEHAGVRGLCVRVLCVRNGPLLLRHRLGQHLRERVSAELWSELLHDAAGLLDDDGGLRRVRLRELCLRNRPILLQHRLGRRLRGRVLQPVWLQLLANVHEPRSRVPDTHDAWLQ